MIPFAFTPLENFRFFFLIFGWVVLVLGSLVIVLEAYNFYVKVEKAVFGKLILFTAFGWLLTTYLLGVVSTTLVYTDVEKIIVLRPFFVVWLLLMFLIGWIIQSWNKEGIELNKLYKKLDVIVIERTQELEEKNDHLTELDKKIVIQNRLLRKAKNKAESAEKKIEAIVESIGDGVFVTDIKGKILIFNKAAGFIAGYPPSEVIGKKHSDVLPFIIWRNNKEKKDDFIERAMASGKITSMSKETFLVCKDGSKLAVADTAAPIKDEKGKVKGCVIVFRDVAQERSVSRMKTEFVSVVSHQLRTPLTAIRWGVESLKTSKYSKLTAKQKNYLNDIEDSSKRMIKLVTDLLNVSRIESGRLRIESEPTDLVKMISASVRELRPIAAAKNLVITFSKPKKRIPLVKIDQSLFYQVVHNLLTNAIRYSQPNNLIKVKLEKVSRKGYIISVKDNGVGIPKAAQKRVFEKFYRAENAARSETDGSGLGLYIVKMILEQSGGKISFESKENIGTTFYVQLPLSGMKSKGGERSYASTS